MRTRRTWRTWRTRWTRRTLSRVSPVILLLRRASQSLPQDSVIHKMFSRVFNVKLLLRMDDPIYLKCLTSGFSEC